MKRTVTLLAIGLFAIGSAAYAAKPIKSMSKEEMIKTSRSAAPSHISDNATVMLPTAEGAFEVAVQGTNEFTCIPYVSTPETPDPFCGDPEATKWIMSAINKEPKPANTAPGVGYMAQGGYHFEKDGKIVDPATPGAKKMKEPPHWMIFWPTDPQITQLPTEPGKFGAYIMYDGTPYSHIMIYQDPGKLVKK